MKNPRKALSLLIALTLLTLADATGIEPVLMNMDGSSIKDKARFHHAHGIVRDWQYKLLYDAGPKPKNAEEVLKKSLAAHGIKAMMVPTALWQLIFCEVNILSPEFERVRISDSGAPESSELAVPHAGPESFDDYMGHSFSAASTDQEAYDIIHNHSKHPKMSRLKQLVDNYILATHGAADNPEAWEAIIRRSVATYLKRMESFPSGRSSYPEDPTLKQPPFAHPGIKSFPLLLNNMENVKKILHMQRRTLENKTLLLMRGTAPMTFSTDSAAYTLQDSPLKLRERSSSRPSPADATSMNSVSFANSYFGGMDSTDPAANVHYYWTQYAPGGGIIISNLELPAGLSPEIRNVFWLPPFFGPLEMLRKGETHPRLKILPRFELSGGGIMEKEALQKKPFLHTPYTLEGAITQYHRIVAETLSTLIPPCSRPHESVKVKFYREQNRQFSASVAGLIDSGAPILWTHGAKQVP